MKNRSSVGEIKKSDVIKFLSVYVVCALLLFVFRFFLNQYLGKFALGTVLLIFSLSMLALFGVRCIRPIEEKGAVSTVKSKILAVLVFASGVLISIPLLYLGDYISTKSGFFYNNQTVFNGSIVFFIVFVWVIPSVLFDLCFKRIVCNIMAPRQSAWSSRLVLSSLCAIFFFDITLFFSTFVMAGFLMAVQRISSSAPWSVGCSLVWGAVVCFFCYMFYIDANGVQSMGIVGILGMLLIFTSVAAVILCVVRPFISSFKPSYIEVISVGILILIMFIVGCVLTSV